jgi:hypothetical protein
VSDNTLKKRHSKFNKEIKEEEMIMLDYVGRIKRNKIEVLSTSLDLFRLLSHLEYDY